MTTFLAAADMWPLERNSRFDPNRLGQQYRRTKVRPVCKGRAVGLGASTNGTTTFVLNGCPPVEPHCRAWKNVAFWRTPSHVNSGGRAARLEAEMQPLRRLADLLVL